MAAETGQYDTENVGPQYRRGRLYSVDVRVPQFRAQMANTRLEYLSFLNVFEKPLVPRNTGIICTIGPKCNSVETLKELIENGMCISRHNFSHGDHETHTLDIASVRMAASQVPGKVVAIALDTKGPEIRTGLLKGATKDVRFKIKLKAGEELKLTTDDKEKESGDEKCIYVDYKNIVKVVKLNDTIYIDDGLISLKVTGKGPTHITAVVENSGLLGSRKGVNLPDTKVDLPALTDKDKEDIRFGIEHDVDMVFASFVRKAEDVAEIRKELGERGKHILIVSKVENKEGVENFDEILRASDGIMVARGDLGIEIPPEKVFLAQKMMIGRCNRAGKPVIVATQMLESMTEKPRSTRAEATDVANAVLDGADCVMLSGETADGKYPVKAVAFMSKVCLEAEAAMFHRVMFDDLRHLTPRPTPTVQTAAIAAVNASFQQDAAAIMTLTITGRTAFELSKYRPRCPIIAITSDSRTARLCHLHRGVRPLLYTEPPDSDWAKDIDKCFDKAILKGKEERYLETGSTIIQLSGWKPGPAHINTLRITQVE